MHPQIQRGRPIDALDALGNVLALPAKVMFLTPDIDAHRISPVVERSVETFLGQHPLPGLAVRLNQWDPGDEWNRLWSPERRVNIVWRILFGLPLWLNYVLNCGRVFGGDHYNPFTDTVNLYSDHPAIATHEMGHALDFRNSPLPGLYALVGIIPLVPLWQEFMASRHAILSLRAIGAHYAEIRAYRMLWPAYFTYIFGTLVNFVPAVLLRLLFFPLIAMGFVLGMAHSMMRYGEISREQKLAFTLGSQMGDEWRKLKILFDPSSRWGRGMIGAVAGAVIGAATGVGFGGIIGAVIGYLILASTVKTPPAEPPPGYPPGGAPLR